MAYGLTGTLRDSCRTPWMAALLRQCTGHTMTAESVLGRMKAAQKKRHTGNDPGAKAIVNAKMSKVLDMEAKMSPAEREVVDLLLRQKLEHFELWDDTNQAAADAAEAERALRDMEKRTKAAARGYANAKVYHACSLLPAKDIAGDLKQKEIGAVGVFDEQMKIITVGYGHKDLAFRPRPLKKDLEICQDCCPGCGAEWGDVSNHRQKHIVWAHSKVDDRGGKPDEPPLPMVTIGNRPPVIDTDQSRNPITKFEAEVMRLAQNMVDTGKVVAEVEMVGAGAAHAIDETLVGKIIQYSANISRNKGDKCTERYTYTGRVARFNGDAVLKIKNPAYKMAVAKRRRSKSKSKGRSRGSVTAVPVPQYLEEHCPSVCVQWFDQGEGASAVFLKAEKYNMAKVVDGWVVVDETKPYNEDSRTTLEKLKQEAMEADLLFHINM